MIRSVLLRLMAFLVVLVPLLVVVSWLSRVVLALPQQRHVDHAVARTVVRVSAHSGTSIIGGPSLTPSVIDKVLVSVSSPARGTGQALYDLSSQYHIDDAYALAVFAEESSFGKAGAAASTHGLGNIICAGYPTCIGRFRSYGTWQEGYTDFYRLLATEYIPRGLSTVEKIEPVYAPSNENDVGLYVGNVVHFMRVFRNVQENTV